MKVATFFTGGKTPAPSSHKHPLHGYKFVKSVPVARNDLTQAEAKQFLPPDTYLWRANTKGCWMARVLPHGSHSETWSKHGGDSAAALWAIIRFVWAQWLDDKCLPHNQCPIQGVF